MGQWKNQAITPGRPGIAAKKNLLLKVTVRGKIRADGALLIAA